MWNEPPFDELGGPIAVDAEGDEFPLPIDIGGVDLDVESVIGDVSGFAVVTIIGTNSLTASVVALDAVECNWDGDDFGFEDAGSVLTIG